MRRPLIHPFGAIAVTALAASVALSACSPGGGSGGDDGRTSVTFRLWDDQVAQAYEESFAAFEEVNDDNSVDIELVPWGDYFDKLTTDIGSGNAPDIFWTNTSNFGIHADNDRLLDIHEHLGDQQQDWKQSVVDLYTRDGTRWGVPQLWDSIALFYNTQLVDAAGVDPATLRWDPEPGSDTFLPAARSLTIDSAGNTADEPGFDPASIDQFGFNAAYDGQAIFWNFVGSNGGVWQSGDEFAYNNPDSIEAMQYVVDLINSEHVAPSAADTNDNGDRTRDLFLQGNLALFQSGPYNLKNIEEAAEFDWAIAPMLEGPAGRVGVVHGVAAVASAEPADLDATVRVLEWLGSADGQRPIAEGGYAFPGVTSVEQDYISYWEDQGVDITPFLESAEGDTIPAPIGPRVQAGTTAAEPILKEMFIGRLPVEEAMADAEATANEAIAD